MTTGWVFVSLGQTFRMFKWGIFQATIMVVAFIIGLPWGPVGVALAATGCLCANTVPTMMFAYHKSPIRIADIWGVIRRPMVFSCLILFVGLAVRETTLSFSLMGRIGVVLISVLLVLLCAIWLWRSLREDIKGILYLVRS